VEGGLGKSSEADKPYLLKLQGIITHLELMADKIAGLAEPIRRKGNHGAILSDRDFFHINDLFSQQMGFMRALVDIFHYDDVSISMICFPSRWVSCGLWWISFTMTTSP